MNTYVEIPLNEMKSFLEKEGFILHKRDERTEWVANKIVQTQKASYVIRIFTSINPEDKSRGVGSDAIKLGVFSSTGHWIMGNSRVNRTKNWQKNILERIKSLNQKLGTIITVDAEILEWKVN